MDRLISPQQLNRQKFKTYLVGAIISIAIVFSAVQFKKIVKPSVSFKSLSIAEAEVGPMEATIAASGVVLPGYEILITSPVASKIEKVLHHAGETVEAGDPILQLNRDASLLAFEKLNEEQQGCAARGTIKIRATSDYLAIANSGPSIPREVSEQLFSPFFSTKKNGQGVGLMLIKEILMNHGFAFSLESKEGWTEFKIALHKIN